MTAGRTNSNPLSNNWCTPPKYVELVREFFQGSIDLDPCSSQYSIVGAQVEFRLPETDGLSAEWEYETIYVNPPYGTDRVRGTGIRDWLRKCAEARRRYGSEVLALVPVATNTRHWKMYVWGAATSVAFLYDTRLKFFIDGQESEKGAPMSCAMVHWGERAEEFRQIFSPLGAVVDVRECQAPSIGWKPRS